MSQAYAPGRPGLPDRLGGASWPLPRPPKLEVPAMPDQAPGDEAPEFAGAFRAFLDWIHSPARRAKMARRFGPYGG